MKRVLTVLPILTVGFLFVLLFLFPDRAASAAAEGLSLCGKTVVPTLFPFMTLSSVIVSLKLSAPAERFFPSKTFRLPSCAGSAMLLGLICGFPVGASSAARLREEGRITRNEAARLTAVSSAASPAFLIGTVGAMWQNRAFGAFLYVIQTAAALLTALVLRNRTGLTGPAASDSGRKTAESVRETIPGFGSVFRRSVSSAAQSCLNVTAFVTFFRMAAALISCPAPKLEPLAASVFEFSSGCAAGASLGGPAGAFLTGFSAGLGGLSVFLQISAFTEPQEIPFSPTVCAMLIRGIVMGLAGALFFGFFPAL